MMDELSQRMCVFLSVRSPADSYLTYLTHPLLVFDSSAAMAMVYLVSEIGVQEPNETHEVIFGRLQEA